MARSLIVIHDAARPHDVVLGVARIKVVRAALLESCDVAAQREAALVVLVHVQVPVLDPSQRLRSPAAPARTVVLRVRGVLFRLRDVLILGRGGGRRRLRRRPVGLARSLDGAQPTPDLVAPGQWPILPLVLLHPVLGTVDLRRCRRFLGWRACGSRRRRARRPPGRGVGL